MKEKNSSHCHCSLWAPSEGLIDSVLGGQAWQRYSKDTEDKKLTEDAKRLVREEARSKDSVIMKDDLKREERKLTKLV